MKKLIILSLLLISICGIAQAEWTYQILNKRLDNDTIWVTVRYTDGTKIETVEIPIFQPKTKDDVITAITNRKETVKIKQEAIERNKIIINEVRE